MGRAQKSVTPDVMNDFDVTRGEREVPGLHAAKSWPASPSWLWVHSLKFYHERHFQKSLGSTGAGGTGWGTPQQLPQGPDQRARARERRRSPSRA